MVGWPVNIFISSWYLISAQLCRSLHNCMDKFFSSKCKWSVYDARSARLWWKSFMSTNCITESCNFVMNCVHQTRCRHELSHTLKLVYYCSRTPLFCIFKTQIFPWSVTKLCELRRYVRRVVRCKCIRCAVYLSIWTTIYALYSNSVLLCAFYIATELCHVLYIHSFSHSFSLSSGRFTVWKLEAFHYCDFVHVLVNWKLLTLTAIYLSPRHFNHISSD
jgi:hypothetical protein